MEKLNKKYPKGVLSFYIKLYCKRKRETGKKCGEQEALKSWTSLNKSEKTIITKKYNEHQSNFKRNIALYLKNAEPYMKSKTGISNRVLSSKYSKSKNGKIENVIQNELTDTKIETIDHDDSAVPTSNIHNTEIKDSNNEISFLRYTQENSDLENHDLHHENSKIEILPTPQDAVISMFEPTAPKVMTGKELFLIIKEREKNDYIWEKFTNTQKRRYTNAVLAIKKNYLKQYRDYLEHLPSEKLFYHYKNIVS